MIHPSAIIDPTARLAEDVSVGPWTLIGADVEIGPGCRIDTHVVIKGPTRIGSNNHIYSFASIGDDPQDKKYDQDVDSVLEIGDDNTIREYCTINRGTALGGGITRVGSHNWIMAYAHIAHDCQVGDHTIFANNASLAGHAVIEDHVILGGFTGVHQFCRLGAHSFTAASTLVLKDVPPFVMVSGNPAKAHGLNREGLKRRGFSREELNALRQAYRIIYRQGLTLEQATEELLAQAGDCAPFARMAAFLAQPGRGIVR